LPEVRGEEERDSAFGFQRGERRQQWRFGQIIRRVLWRRWKLLWRWLRLQLTCDRAPMLISYSSLLLFVTGAAILLVFPGPAVT
jgi:hypothetical protein